MAPGKHGATPPDAPPIFERLGLGMSSAGWCELVRSFGKLFKMVAGKPHVVDQHRGVHLCIVPSASSSVLKLASC